MRARRVVPVRVPVAVTDLRRRRDLRLELLDPIAQHAASNARLERTSRRIATTATTPRARLSAAHVAVPQRATKRSTKIPTATAASTGAIGTNRNAAPPVRAPPDSDEGPSPTARWVERASAPGATLTPSARMAAVPSTGWPFPSGAPYRSRVLGGSLSDKGRAMAIRA